MCIIFHKWGKWKRYTQDYIGTFRFGQKKGDNYHCNEDRQTRICDECGKTQDELIK